jgi:hypothetical protein
MVKRGWKEESEEKRARRRKRGRRTKRQQLRHGRCLVLEFDAASVQQHYPK